MTRNTTHKTNIKRQRTREREIKQQQMDSEPIIISDSEHDEEEGFVRVARHVKPELKRILHSFQADENNVVFISEQLRNPRYDKLSDYIAQLNPPAHNVRQLLTEIGASDTPLSKQNRTDFTRFAHTLESLARRIRSTVADQAP